MTGRLGRPSDLPSSGGASVVPYMPTAADAKAIEKHYVAEDTAPKAQNYKLQTMRPRVPLCLSVHI